MHRMDSLKVLKELVAKKIVVKRGKQRGSYYILNKELDIYGARI